MKWTVTRWAVEVLAIARSAAAGGTVGCGIAGDAVAVADAGAVCDAGGGSIAWVRVFGVSDGLACSLQMANDAPRPKSTWAIWLAGAPRCIRRLGPGALDCWDSRLQDATSNITPAERPDVERRRTTRLVMA